MSELAQPTFDAETFLANCSRQPGIYRMLDAQGDVLYVGKARNLQARLRSYFQKQHDSIKTRAMMARVVDIQTTVTSSDTEALLLEQSLIKQQRPPYNVLLRDDKSYPYIKLTLGDTYPRIAFHRGARKGKSQYFGPYPGSNSVRETLNLIEKVFRLRNCRDSYFRNRTRPCLQYQINRCTAPCVGLVSEEDYARQVAMAKDFLEGRDEAITIRLGQEMDQAAADLQFEKAADLRDQIAAIRDIQQRQYVDTGRGNADVIAMVSEHGDVVVECLMIRAGRVTGHISHFPKVPADSTDEDILEGFIGQYYLHEEAGMPPSEILLDRPLSGHALIAEALQQRYARKVRLAWAVRRERQAWLRMASTNARQALISHQANRRSIADRLAAAGQLLGMEMPPARIECFDISHTGGEQAVASCVVFTAEGEARQDYRRFNVTPVQEGDDYAAIGEAVRRRYQRVAREGKPLPDILLIDGGKGQTRRAAEVLAELDMDGAMTLVGISKGPSRKAGLEQLHLIDGQVMAPQADDPGLHLLQRVRDEAHRFALAGHRARRSKPRKGSTLESIPGIGPKRRQQLLNHFGGLARLRDASREELEQVPGISRDTAQVIHDWFHE